MNILDSDAVLERLASGASGARLVHVHRAPARPGVTAALPSWLDSNLAASLHRDGIDQLWVHQREAADLAHAGRHVVIATGTASGKSLSYLLPLLTDLAAGARGVSGRDASALYLSPTKALAADQLARVERVVPPGVRVATYDGDTPQDERRWSRRHAAYLLSNPDMLHYAVLPGHAHWSGFLRALRYVVVDECHVYRGVFGSHLAAVLRRLRRVAARYGAHPTFVFASATVSDPAEQAQSLIGLPVTAITHDSSPHGPAVYAFLQPVRPRGRPPEGAEVAATDDTAESDEPSAPSALAVSSHILTDLVRDGVRTVAFARSRLGVEVIATRAQRNLDGRNNVRQLPTFPEPDSVRMSAARLTDSSPRAAGLTDSSPPRNKVVAAYRGGYLPEERRALEADLRSGRLLGLAATSALELGIDIRDLDAVVLAGWPGTRAAFWQRAGRAGRSGLASLAVLVASNDPLDRYLIGHPEAIFEAPVEASVLDPANPFVLAPHLAAAAAELPLTEEDIEVFGPTMPALASALVSRGLLRRRQHGWYWTRPERAADLVSLRGIGDQIRIVESGTGRVLGTVDASRADASVHTGAVYLHQQQPYVVTELELVDGTATVVAGDPGWSTQARSVSDFDVLGIDRQMVGTEVSLHVGSVAVRTQVTSFVRRLPTGRVIGEHRLDLPERTLKTKAVWWTMTPEALADADIGDVPGAARAAEHAAIGLLPLLATADRWDIGGVSTEFHPDTGLPTVMVYDGLPGGAGIAERGFARWRDWLSRTRDVVQSCGCATGCPGCVQSPKCGNGNEPLDKAGAVRLLDLVLTLLPVDTDDLRPVSAAAS